MRKKVSVKISETVLQERLQQLLSPFKVHIIRGVVKEHFIAWDKFVYPLDRKRAAIRKLQHFLAFIKKILIPDPRKVKETIPHIKWYEIFDYYQKLDKKIQRIQKLSLYRDRQAALNQLLEKEKIKQPQPITKFEAEINGLKSNRRPLVCRIVGKKFSFGPSAIRDVVSKMEQDKHGIFHIRSCKRKKRLEK